MFGSIVKGYCGIAARSDIAGAYQALLLPGIIAGGISFLVSWSCTTSRYSGFPSSTREPTPSRFARDNIRVAPMMTRPLRKFAPISDQPAAAGTGFVVSGFLVASGIFPVDRRDWLLENFLVVVFIGLLGRYLPPFPLSVCFICPDHRLYDAPRHRGALHLRAGPSRHLGQRGVHQTRNHYDRLVHFSFGLMLAYPAREIFLRVANARGFWPITCRLTSR